MQQSTLIQFSTTTFFYFVTTLEKRQTFATTGELQRWIWHFCNCEKWGKKMSVCWVGLKCEKSYSFQKINYAICNFGHFQNGQEILCNSNNALTLLYSRGYFHPFHTFTFNRQITEPMKMIIPWKRSMYLPMVAAVTNSFCSWHLSFER